MDNDAHGSRLAHDASKGAQHGKDGEYPKSMTDKITDVAYTMFVNPSYDLCDRYAISPDDKAFSATINIITVTTKDWQAVFSHRLIVTQ